jgi:signal transduction histidine kinase
MKTSCPVLPTPRVRVNVHGHAVREVQAVPRSRDASNLAARLLAAQESERRRIARELHDNVCQKLALLCSEINSLSAQAAVMPPALADAIANLSERARDITSDVHCLSHDLHPPLLELVGVSQAIAGLCHDLSSRFSIRIEFRQGDGRPCVSGDDALCLFRVTQEALQNVVKHSGAGAATVRLAQTRQNIHLHVSDTGKGFAASSNDGAGLGLLSMRERVRTAGGRIAIRSVPGQGTRVAVRLPSAAPPVSGMTARDRQKGRA